MAHGYAGQAHGLLGPLYVSLKALMDSLPSGVLILQKRMLGETSGESGRVETGDILGAGSGPPLTSEITPLRLAVLSLKAVTRWCGTSSCEMHHRQICY